MTPDEQALQAAIVAEPNDHVPRLIYADWLEERGESARAEGLRQLAQYVWINVRVQFGSDARCNRLIRDRPGGNQWTAEVREHHSGSWAPAWRWYAWWEARGYTSGYEPRLAEANGAALRCLLDAITGTRAMTVVT